jgi:hypothetical protein
VRANDDVFRAENALKRARSIIIQVIKFRRGADVPVSIVKFAAKRQMKVAERIGGWMMLPDLSISFHHGR